MLSIVSDLRRRTCESTNGSDLHAIDASGESETIIVFTEASLQSRQAPEATGCHQICFVAMRLCKHQRMAFATYKVGRPHLSCGHTEAVHQQYPASDVMPETPVLRKNTKSHPAMHMANFNNNSSSPQVNGVGMKSNISDSDLVNWVSILLFRSCEFFNVTDLDRPLRRFIPGDQVKFNKEDSATREPGAVFRVVFTIMVEKEQRWTYTLVLQSTGEEYEKNNVDEHELFLHEPAPQRNADSA